MANSKTTKTPTKAKSNLRQKSKTSARTATPLQVTEIRMIPLSQLKLSPKNVRKVAPSETEDTELLASIREKGIARCC